MITTFSSPSPNLAPQARAWEPEKEYGGLDV
jgi:hypothetical protein